MTFASLFSAAFWCVAGMCFAAPLVWLMLIIVSNPAGVVELRLDAYRLELLGRTVFYNLAVALVSFALAIPAAVALGRPRGWLTAPLMILLPVTLLLPSITYEYGWKQALRLTGMLPSPQSVGDIGRCVWTLAAWLWPIPAAVAALVLRRVDPTVFEQALLDGVPTRTTLRLALQPLTAGAMVVFVLSAQEFAVFEPSGISVVATEVRMVFETGAFSSPTNPITQTFGAGAAPGADHDQPARSAAAIATGLPLTLCTLAVVVVGFQLARRWTVETELQIGPRPSAIRASVATHVIAYAILAVSMALPVAALLVSLERSFDPVRVLREFWPQISGSILLAAASAAVAALLVPEALRRRRLWVIAPAALCFLLGGQLTAIGLIRIFNRSTLAWVYDSPVVAIVAYVCRFGWIALAASLATWQRPWQNLRDMSAVDGATVPQAVWRVVMPLAWPLISAAALLVAVLSLTEVAATMLVAPQRPQPIVPMLMSWVHLQRYDAMIEGTLLLSGVVMIMALAVVAMAWLASRRLRRARLVA
ncbi:MAG: hypothetical protein RMJ35_06350 [Phycisphaerales bacterium]|nr:hypothetical protein [Phycisphaerales bacterium]